MPDVAILGIFVAASLPLLLVPGPAVLYIVARGVEGGRFAGLVSMLGVQAGAVVHIAFAAAGLSALLASSAAAFSTVKWLGAAYLIWLGISRLLAREETETPASGGRKRPGNIFWQGALVNVLNPKAALFFLAFLPQFVDPSQGAAWTQILFLGATFIFLAMCTDSLYALTSGTAGGWLERKYENGRFRRGQRYFSGGIYLVLGLATALSGSRKI
ncbi:MAG: LysE family translocator [Rubrobacteraceae bacterium]